MLRILALFDAPIPAQRALAALAADGFAPGDVWSVPLVPGPAFARLLAPVTDLAAVRAALARLAVPTDLVEVAVDGVRRGAILILVETPTASASRAAACLDGAGALDPRDLAALWRDYPGTTYDWAAIGPPAVDPPAPPAPTPAAAMPDWPGEPDSAA